MKRLLVLALMITLTACGGSGKKAEQADTNATPTMSPEEIAAEVYYGDSSEESISAESVVESVEETPEPTSTPAPVTIDFDKCYQQMREEGATELYDFVQDFYVGLQEDGKTINISIIVDEATDPQKALEYTHMLIKELNYYAAEQDKTLEAASSASYGGLYDKYHALVGVATPSTTDDVDEYLIYDAITYPGQFVSLKK